MITRSQAPALMEQILTPVCAGGEGSARGDAYFGETEQGKGGQEEQRP